MELIFLVTFLCLISKTIFLMHIKIIFTERAITGKEMSMTPGLERIRMKRSKQRMFSKWTTESMMKYQRPMPPWYLFA